MAGTITFSGLSSGLDTSSWIDALVSVKQSTISSLQDKLTIQQNIQNVVSNIKSFFTSFQSCLQKITDSQFGVANMDVFAQNIVNSSNINIATASATTEAARQSYDVLVEQLATYTKAKSGYKDVEVIKADLDTTLGQLGMKKGTITVGTGSFTVTENDTIRDLVAKFNSIGVTASFDEPKAKLTVNTDVNSIDDGSTKLKSVFGLENNPTQITVPKPGGSLMTPEHIVTIYADGNTLLSEFGITNSMSYTAYAADDSVLASDISNIADISIDDFIELLQSQGLDASFDTSLHKIIIKNGRISGDVADKLGMSQSTYNTEVLADGSTTLEQLGATGDLELSVNGGTAMVYSKTTDLDTIMQYISDYAENVSLENGILTVTGVTLSGGVADLLGLQVGSTVSGETLTYSTTIQIGTSALVVPSDTPVTGSTKLSELGIMTSQTLSDGTNNWTFDPDKTFDEINSELQATNADLALSVSDGVVTITNSGTSVSALSGTLLDTLGMTISNTTTSIMASGSLCITGSPETLGTPEIINKVSEQTTFVSGVTYTISDASDLNKLAQLVNAGVNGKGATFILTQDIDMSGVANFRPIGNYSYAFCGTFDGQGHVISNLTISAHSACGLFGNTGWNEIRNVGLENLSLAAESEKNGGLAGYAEGTTITNCYVTGSVTSNRDYSIGGLVGYAYRCTITNSYATASVTGESAVGGLVGYSDSSTITNSYATGSVTSTRDSGGGLVGGTRYTTYTNVYYNSDANTKGFGYGSAVSGITGKSLSELQNQTFLESIGFTSANGWTYENSTSNPTLLPYVTIFLSLTSTVGELMGGNSGTITVKDGSNTLFNKKYAANTTIQTLISEINTATGGTLTLNDNRTLTFTGAGDISFSGNLAEALKIGAEARKNVTIASYTSAPQVIYAPIDENCTLAELGITSGVANITNSSGNVIDTVDIDNSQTINQLKTQLAEKGLILTIDSDGVVTVTSSENKQIADGTSNLKTGLKLGNATVTPHNIDGSVTMSQIGFYTGTSMTVVVDGTTHVKNYTADNTIQDVIDDLNSLGINASVSDGKFSMTSNTNDLSLSGELADYLLSGSYDIYVSDVLKYATVQSGYISDTLTVMSPLTENTTLEALGFADGGILKVTMNDGSVYNLSFTKDSTMQNIIDELSGIGITTEINNGKLTFSSENNKFILSGDIGQFFNQGATSESAGTENITVNYAVGKDNVSYETETISSVASYADGNTLLSDLNITEGALSIFIDGVKSTVNIETNDTFKTLFDKIVAETGAKGVTVKAGFVTTDGDIAASPEENKNTGVIAIQAEGEHTVFIGASNDTTNFTTIANMHKTENDNLVKGTKALYKANVNSIITEEGLFKTGNVTEGNFYIGDAEFTIDNTTTLNDLIKQINYNEKSYASAYWDTLSGTLVLTSKLSGNSMINIESGTSNFTEIMGLTKKENGQEILIVENQSRGENAQVRINGTLVTSATNTITSDVSRIKGLTINLKGLSNGEHTTITVEQDKDNIYNAVSEVVDSYNALMENFEKEVNTGGTLTSDSNMKLFKNSLKRNMTKSLSSSSLYRNLMSVGISTGKAQDSITTDVTSLIIDKDKFMECLDSNPDEIKNLLVGTKDKSGLFVDIENMVERAISQSGIITITENRLNNNIENYNKKISTQTLALNKYRARLETKFKNMESIISNLQNSYNGLLSQSA